MDNYEKVRKIGRGTYGDVLLVKRKSDQALLALKKVILENISSSSGQESRISNLDKVKQKTSARPGLVHNQSINQQAAMGGTNSMVKREKKFVFEESAMNHQLSTNNEMRHKSNDSHESSKHSSEETQRVLNNEIKILKTLDHPNIIKYHESFVYKHKHLCIITEYAENGDLQKKIKDAKKANRPFPQAQVLDWFCQLALAIAHFHSKHILHRDLKPKNILLAKGNVIKIGDFGISKMLDNTFDMAKTATGTPYYLSPEVCLGQKYDNKSDMWMLGCILYEMCALRRPFEGESLNQVLHKITKLNYQTLGDEFDPIFHKLLELLLQKTASLRASVFEIIDLPEIKEHLLLMRRGQDEHLQQIKYIKPLSQKKHADLEQQAKRSHLKSVQTAPAEEDSYQDKPHLKSAGHTARQEGSKDPSSSENTKKFTFQGEITFGGPDDNSPPRKHHRLMGHLESHQDSLMCNLEKAYPPELDPPTSCKPKSELSHSRLIHEQSKKQETAGDKVQIKMAKKPILINLDRHASKPRQDYFSGQEVEKTPPASNHYLGDQTKTPGSISSSSLQRSNIEKSEKQRRIQDLISQAKSLTSPHYSNHQLSTKNDVPPTTSSQGEYLQSSDKHGPFSRMETQEDNEIEDQDNAGKRKTIHSFNYSTNLKSKQSDQSQAYETYSNTVIEPNSGKESRIKLSISAHRQKRAGESKTVMKIKQPNQSEIEVQLQTNKKKLSYWKLKNSNPKERPATSLATSSGTQQKKKIEINTDDLGPISKHPEALAKKEQKGTKTEIKKANQSSISCGNITVNISHNKEDSYDGRIHTKTSKFAQSKKKYDYIKEPSSTTKMKLSCINKDTQSSNYSPRSFYTPNSFYQQPCFKTGSSHINESAIKEVVDSGKMTCKSGQVFIASQHSSSQNGDDVRVTSCKIPQHPNTITNMHIKQQARLSSEVPDQISQASHLSNQSPFSHLKKQLAKTPQDSFLKQKKALLASNCSSSEAQEKSGGSGDPTTQQTSNYESQGESTKKRIIQQQLIKINPRKPIQTTTHNDSNQKQIVVKQRDIFTSKSGTGNHPLPLGLKAGQKQQSKYFTFDGNGIFNPKNPVSPARSHLATEFVKQKLGKEKYDKVLRILQESEDPLKILDIPQDIASSDSSDQRTALQRQILQLINGDRKFLSIFMYIMNCSFCSSNQSFISGDKSVQSGQSQGQFSSNDVPQQQTPDSSVYTQNQQHTPNSIYAYQQQHTPSYVYNSTSTSQNRGGSFLQQHSQRQMELQVGDEPQKVKLISSSSVRSKIKSISSRKKSERVKSTSPPSLSDKPSPSKAPEESKAGEEQPLKPILIASSNSHQPTASRHQGIEKRGHQTLKEERKEPPRAEATRSEAPRSHSTLGTKTGLFQRPARINVPNKEISLASNKIKIQGGPAQNQEKKKGLFRQRDVSVDKYKIQLTSQNSTQSIGAPKSQYFYPPSAQPTQQSLDNSPYAEIQPKYH